MTGSDILTRRSNQKQLHVWVPEDLKEELARERDRRNCSYTDIVSEALIAHLRQPPGAAPEVDRRLAAIEKTLKQLVGLMAENQERRAPESRSGRAAEAPEAARGSQVGNVVRRAIHRRSQIGRGQK